VNLEQKAIYTTYVSLATNIGLAVIKAFAGVFGQSYALIADAIESLTDVLASFLVLLGFKYAERPPDENHPYGHGKIEPIITFIVVAFLVASALFIAHESIENLRSVQQMPRSWTLWVLGGIILWKEASYQFVIRRARQTGSTSLKADAWHHRSDAITSVLAFVGISFALIMGPGYEKADDWAALLASGFILYNSYLIFRPALGEIMDEHVYDDLIEEIRKKALEVDGILSTEKCFIRKAGMYHHVDLHARVDGDLSVREGHRIAHVLKDHLRQEIPGLGHVLIHIEPND
jgi:cation diffusion facilitator family transporter